MTPFPTDLIGIKSPHRNKRRPARTHDDLYRLSLPHTDTDTDMEMLSRQSKEEEKKRNRTHCYDVLASGFTHERTEKLNTHTHIRTRCRPDSDCRQNPAPSLQHPLAPEAGWKLCRPTVHADRRLRTCIPATYIFYHNFIGFWKFSRRVL